MQLIKLDSFRIRYLVLHASALWDSQAASSLPYKR